MNAASIEDLKSALPKLSAHDAEFASSLIKQFARKGSLSDKQWPYVAKLAAKVFSAHSAPMPTVPEGWSIAPAPAAPVFSQTFVPGAFAAMKSAVPAHHKKPAVILALGNRGKAGALRVELRKSAKGSEYLRLSFASKPGPASGFAYSGTVSGLDVANVSSTTFVPKVEILCALEEFGEDVATVLQKTGLAFGICANCGKTLTHPVSVKMGIGPVCIKLFPSLWPAWKATEAALAVTHPLS